MSGLANSSVMNITPRPDVVMTRGEGSWLWDETGKRYLDFVQGWAVNSLGHAPAAIREALAAQSALLLSPSPAYHNRPQLELARGLARASGLDRVFFCNSGAEANEGAIKLARKWGRKHRDGGFEIITALDAFHGRTLATMAASGKPGWDELFAPRVEGFRKVPYADVAAVESAISPDTVAVMLEPVQGEAGVVVPPEGTLAALRELTRDRGILLILDEIQTGMGRTGPLFSFQDEGITPDIMTLGKGLGGGTPLAALLASESVTCFEPGDQGGTFNGNPLMTAVGCAVLEKLTAPGFLDESRAMGELLRERLEELAARRTGAWVRGRGLLLALVLPEPAAKSIAATCFDEGLIINAPRPEVLRFMPALNVEREEVEAMCEILEGALARTLS